MQPTTNTSGPVNPAPPALTSRQKKALELRSDYRVYVVASFDKVKKEFKLVPKVELTGKLSAVIAWTQQNFSPSDSDKRWMVEDRRSTKMVFDSNKGVL